MTDVSDRRHYQRLLGYVAPYSGIFILSLLGFMLYSACNVLLADLTQFLLDSLGQGGPLETGVVAGIIQWFWPPGDKTALEYARLAVPLAAVAVSIGRAGGFFIGNYFMNVVARSVVHTLRTQLFDVLLYVPKSYYDQHPQGELVSKLTFNVEQVSGAASDALKIVLREGLTVAALISYMLYLNWRLSLIFFAVAPLIGVVVAVVGKHFRRYSRRIQDSMGSVTQVSGETLGAADTLRMFGAESAHSARFMDASLFNRNQSLKLAFVQAVSSPVIQVLLSLALGLLFWFALDPEVLAGFSAGSLVAFMTAAAQMGKPIRTLSGVQSVIQRGLAAAEDVFKQMDTPPEPDHGDRRVNRATGQLTLSDVSFRYPGSDATALSRVSLEIAAGETVAIVGRSGSGKSTLIQLVQRFYQPNEGRILLDGVAIDEIALADYRRQVAVVSQHVQLFSDTVRNNLLLGELSGKCEQAVQAACEHAHAWEFIQSLPRGLDTELGDDGAGLSGGQRQRLAIARAFLKDAPVLILDEATSALDNEAEAKVQEALATMSVGRTTLVIAHRLSTVERADRVVVMDGGKIVAAGSHQMLLAEGGLYAQLYQHEVQ